MRCKFRAQASPAQYQASSLSYTPAQYRQWVAKKTRMASLVALLGLGGGFWVINVAIAPQIAQAQTARVELSLQSQPNETYETLLSRAEAAALAVTEENFDQDSEVTDVSVMVMGQNHGKIAPVLSLEVSRTQWRSRTPVCGKIDSSRICLPNVQRLVTYFTSARSLLGFNGQSGTATEGINSNYGEPSATTPSQTPASSTNQSPPPSNTAVPVERTEGNSQSPTVLPPNSGSPNLPSTSTPAENPQTPSAVTPTGGTIINNPTPTSVPNNSGVIPNNNGIIPNNNGVIPNNNGVIPNNPAATPITPNGNIIPRTTIPNAPGNFNNTIPGATPNQNITSPNVTNLEIEQ